MRITISIFLTTAFLFAFALAEEDRVQDSILPDEMETVEPLDDSETSDLSNSPKADQPLKEGEGTAVPKVAPSASPEQEADAQPNNMALPEGISEEEARWADWADWDKIGGNAKDNSDPSSQKNLIAPQTEDDAVEDSSHAMDQSAIPEINENLDVTRQISAEPDSSGFETPPDQNGKDAQTTNKDQEGTEKKAEQTSSSETPVMDLIKEDASDSKSETPSKTRYLESYSFRQDAPAKINDRISKVVEKIKAVRRQYFDIQLNTEDNSPFEAMMSVCAFGCYTSIYYSPLKEKYNTAGALCWNYPMCETSILAVNPNRLAADDSIISRNGVRMKKFMAHYPHGRLTSVPRNESGTVFPYIGYCQQERSGEFLSMLAIARVAVDYEFTPRMQMDIDVLIANEDDSDEEDSAAPLPVHSSGLTFTVADLVSDAMANCRGGDMSSLLTCLSYYVPREKWTNAWGEEWSVLRIMEHELKRKVNLSDSDSTDRLYGLTYALRRRLAFDDRRLEMQYAVVDEYLERMKDFALSLQNDDGSFNGEFFTRKGKSRNPDDDFAATAHFARWLTILYHSSALDDPQLTQMIEFLVSELEERLEDWNPAEMSQKEVRAVAYALQAIAIYQQRWTKQ